MLLPFVHAVASGVDLLPAEAEGAMDAIICGEVTDAQIAAFLIALHLKKETAGELAGFARSIRKAALPVPFECPPGETLLDTCGTGGDGHNTFNISTTVAFVVAGCEVRVAKHGNRAVSSSSGSADVLEHLGVTIAVSGEQAAQALREAGICFLFAPAFHPALKQVQRIRRELKMRTAFNLLGPLSNPAPTRAQIVGTPSVESAKRVAEALAVLGLERGFVVHGDDGLDEVSLTGPTTVFEIVAGAIRRTSVAPEDFGMSRVNMDALRGGTPLENAAVTRAILDGQAGPCREIVIANAALALVAAGKETELHRAVGSASRSIDSGAAKDSLQRLAGIK